MKSLLSIGLCLCPLVALADTLLTATSENDAVGNVSMALVQSTSDNPNGFAWTILETNGVSNRGFVEVIAPGGEPSSILQPAGWSHFVSADGDRWRITWVYDGLVPADPNEAVTIGASPLNFSFFSAMDQAFQDAPSPLVLEGTLFGRRPTGLPLPFPSAQFGTVAFTSTGTLASGSNTPPTATGFDPVSFDVAAGAQVIDLATGFDDAEDGAAGLTYAIIANTFPELLANTVIDNMANELTLTPRTNLLGNTQLTLQATDTSGLQVTATLEVEATGTAYLQWLNDQFAPSELIDNTQEASTWGPLADSDADGLSNVAEAYHGTDPNIGNTLPFEAIAPDGSGTPRFQWSTSATDHGIAATLQWSINHIDWFDDGDNGRSFVVAPPTATEEGLEFTALFPSVPEDERLFIRLQYHTP